MDPQKLALAVLEDIESAVAEGQAAADEWDYDRLLRAMNDIAAHVEAWKKGPTR
jgi:hypothetical protein